MTHIYLDHAATTPMHPAVVDEMTRIMTTVYGNPSSIHQFGRQAHSELEKARETVAQAIHAEPQEIIFNSGGTEGDNTAIIQTALAREHLGKHIITLNVEHSAVLKSLAFLAERGFDITYLPVAEDGSIQAADVAAALRDDTILVTMMYGNNETGNLYPIAEVGQLLAAHQAYFHVDAVQAFGTEAIDVKQLQVDFLSVSAHKINGPKGVGFLYLRGGISIEPYAHGGEQEFKKRAGTENLAGIAGLAKAVQLLDDDAKAAKRQTYQQFKDIILQELTAAQIPFEINGDPANSLAHILNLWVKGIKNNVLLLNLDLAGFAVSTGSACSAGDVKPSRVIVALRGESSPAATESIRISFGLGLTEADIRRFAAELVKIITRLKHR